MLLPVLFKGMSVMDNIQKPSSHKFYLVHLESGAGVICNGNSPFKCCHKFIFACAVTDVLLVIWVSLSIPIPLKVDHFRMKHSVMVFVSPQSILTHRYPFFPYCLFCIFLVWLLHLVFGVSSGQLLSII